MAQAPQHPSLNPLLPLPPPPLLQHPKTTAFLLFTTDVVTETEVPLAANEDTDHADVDEAGSAVTVAREARVEGTVDEEVTEVDLARVEKVVREEDTVVAVDIAVGMEKDGVDIVAEMVRAVVDTVEMEREDIVVADVADLVVSGGRGRGRREVVVEGAGIVVVGERDVEVVSN